MLDLRFFRENLDQVRTGIARKKFDCDLDALIELDEQRRSIIRLAEEKRAAQKAANAEMAKLDKKSEAFRDKVAEMRELAGEVKKLEKRKWNLLHYRSTYPGRLTQI